MLFTHLTVPPPVINLTRSPSEGQLYTTTQLNLTCSVLVDAAVDTEVLVQGIWSGPFDTDSSQVYITGFNGTSHIHTSVARFDYLSSGQYTCSVAVAAKNLSYFFVRSDLTSQTLEIIAGSLYTV